MRGRPTAEYLASFRNLGDDDALALIVANVDERAILRSLRLVRARSWKRHTHRPLAAHILRCVHGESFRSAINALTSVMKPEVVSEELWLATVGSDRDRDFASYYFYGTVAGLYGEDCPALDRWKAAATDLPEGSE